MNKNLIGSPEERARIELLESFFKRFGKEFKDALSSLKLSVEEYAWADWFYFPLDTARTDEVLEFPEEANCLVRVTLVGRATIKIDNPRSREIELATNPRIYGLPFKRIYLSNEAMSGGKLLLLIGKGNFNVDSTPQPEAGEINSYSILNIDLMFDRSDKMYEINGRQIQLLEKSNDNWSIKLNSNKNDSIDGSYIDPGDIIKGDGARPGYFKYLYFTNPAGSGSVKFLISRDLPFRSPTDDEVAGALLDPPSEPTYPPSYELPPYQGSNFEFIQKLNDETDIAGKYVAYQDNYVFALGASGKVYMSQDYGNTWQQKGTIPYTDFQTACIGYGDGVLIVIVARFDEPYIFRIYRSIDYGETFNLVYQQDNFSGRIEELKYMGNNYWWACAYGSSVVMGNKKSFDHGINWTDDDEYETRKVAVQAWGSVWYGLQANGAFVKSTDYGTNWTIISTPYSLDYTDSKQSCRIKVTLDEILLWAPGENIAYSFDSGQTWNYVAVPGTITTPKNFVYLGNLEVLLVGMGCGAIMRSTDGGANWVSYGVINEATDIWWLEILSETEMCAIINGANVYKPKES